MTNDVDTDAEMLAIAQAIASPDHPIKTETARWAADELAVRDRVEADHQSSFAADDWARCAERGILGLMVPAEFGGAEANLATTLLTLEGLGLGCRDNGLTFAIASQMLSTQDVLVRFGSREQQERWLRPMVDGAAIGAFAMTELATGSDAYNVSTTAQRRSDGNYVINGHKAYITFAPVCDMAIIFASTNPGAGMWGLSAFIVPTDLNGVELLPNREKMGMRTTPFSDINLTDVVVPPSALIGNEGSGASIFNATIQIERSFVFVTQIGAMQRQLADAVRYAQEREQGGRPIGHYQAVAHRIVEMKQQLETARLFLYRAALAVITGHNVPMHAALAKIVGAETGMSAAVSAASVHGALGYVSEFEIERNVRDAFGGFVYSGTSDIQRNIVARLMGLT
jgi:alkylation response protein AidB-like acyl-CoA dehydrogenase